MVLEFVGKKFVLKWPEIVALEVVEVLVPGAMIAMIDMEVAGAVLKNGIATTTDQGHLIGRPHAEEDPLKETGGEEEEEEEAGLAAQGDSNLLERSLRTGRATFILHSVTSFLD